MKYLKDCSIEELEARIKELNGYQKEQDLEHAEDIVDQINVLIKQLKNDTGYDIDTYDSDGYRIQIEEITYEDKFGCFNVKE